MTEESAPQDDVLAGAYKLKRVLDYITLGIIAFALVALAILANSVGQHEYHQRRTHCKPGGPVDCITNASDGRFSAIVMVCVLGLMWLYVFWCYVQGMLYGIISHRETYEMVPDNVDELLQLADKSAKENTSAMAWGITLAPAASKARRAFVEMVVFGGLAAICSLGAWFVLHYN